MIRFKLLHDDGMSGLHGIPYVREIKSIEAFPILDDGYLELLQSTLLTDGTLDNLNIVETSKGCKILMFDVNGYSYTYHVSIKEGK